jgi:hypothetical protein
MFTFFKSKFPNASKEDFEKCLSLLNDIGILLWFANEKLSTFVFNDIGSVIGMLKHLFVHDMEMLSYEQIYGLLPSHPIDRTQHEDNLTKLKQEGILDMSILQVFAGCCVIETDFLADLLDHLQIAYYHSGNLWLLFPWYLYKTIPADICIEKYKRLSKNKLMVIVCVEGYLPCIFFNRFILGIYPYLEPQRTDVVRHIWDRHLCLEIDDITFYLEQDKEDHIDRITLYLSAPLDVDPIHQVWALLRQFLVVLEKIWYSFPGLVLDCFQKCPHCGICKWRIRDNIKQMCRPGQKSQCIVEHLTKWPSSMIYPLPDGNLFNLLHKINIYLLLITKR